VHHVHDELYVFSIMGVGMNKKEKTSLSVLITLIPIFIVFLSRCIYKILMMTHANIETDDVIDDIIYADGFIILGLLLLFGCFYGISEWWKWIKQ
jgi:hypothetical protein